MYLIIMNPSDNPYGYRGAICIIDNSPYCITGEQGPDLFSTEKEAEKTIKHFQKLRPKVKFEVMPVGTYLKMVDSPFENQCKWVNKMREKFPE